MCPAAKKKASSKSAGRRGPRKKVGPKRKRGQRGPDKRPRKKAATKPTPPKSKGRPPGTTNALPKGTVAALRACRHRVPDGLDPKLADVADYMLYRITQMAMGRIKQSPTILGACRTVREEICGPVPKTIEHQGNLTIEVISGITRNPDDPLEEDDPVPK